ncbi:MAG: phosphoribosylglycinamide formyltransferase [Bacteroidales bacterium]|jgi:phosphoribosylglycinamide formyltransferase-1|nr:phosphoribosylglycinamide formyltransferase [Bacteroidales bacterium]
MIKVALFASGNGTNVQQIAEYFLKNDNVKIETVIVNKSDAYVLERAKKLGIETAYFNKNDFYNTDNVLKYLFEKDIDWIVLAGFLWLIPENLLKKFNNKIINIHPALLPLYGGKGMYGHFVHEAVIAAKEKISGITVHTVNKDYDKGKIIFQARCKIMSTDTPQTLAEKIHLLEKEYFPTVIASLLASS